MTSNKQSSKRDEGGSVLPLPETMDHILELADAELLHNLAPRRPQHILNKLRKAGVNPTDRLAYRPQPVMTGAASLDHMSSLTVQDACSARGDFSLGFLQRDFPIALYKNSSIRSHLWGLTRDMETNGTQFLSHMDAAAHAPPLTGQIASSAVHFVDVCVSHIKESAQNIWQPTTSTSKFEPVPNHVRNCMHCAYIQRLMFYDARRKGHSSTAYYNTMAQLRKTIGISGGFKINKMLELARFEVDIE